MKRYIAPFISGHDAFVSEHRTLIIDQIEIYLTRKIHFEKCSQNLIVILGLYKNSNTSQLYMYI